MGARLSYCDKKEKAAELHFLRENNLSKGEHAKLHVFFRQPSHVKYRNVAKVHPFQAFDGVEREIVAKVHQFNHESSIYAQKVEKRCTFASFLAMIAGTIKIAALLQLTRWKMEQA